MGHDPVDPLDLRYVFEKGLLVLASFATVIA